jgi:hypothetical protein
MDCSRPASRDPDEWLQNCPDFPRPICEELREQILQWEPDLTESVKWNMLAFSGRKLVFALSGCKKHVGLTFFRGTELDDPSGIFTSGEAGFLIRSIRITDIAKLDFPALKQLIRAAVRLDAGDIPPPKPQKRAPMPMPGNLAKALRRDKQAAAGFQKLSASCQREYFVWIASAKRPETVERRLVETLAAVRDGRKWMRRND